MRHTLTESSKYELLRLDNQLCFALYAATRAVTRTYRQGLDPIGITYPQYLVLVVLWEHDGATISEIGTHLMLDSGTLTPIVKRLETEGLVKRQRRKRDEREVEVWLTPQGYALQESAQRARDEVVCELKMSECEIMTLRADLMALIDRLKSDSQG